MDRYHTLASEHRRVQRIVDRFNANEQVWRRLGLRRRLRRAVRRNLTDAQLRELDLRDFARARPPEDCIGEWIER
jgi:hypothetical protein